MKLISGIVALASAAVILMSACGTSLTSGATSTTGVGGHGETTTVSTGLGLGGASASSAVGTGGTGGDANCTHCALAISSIMKVDTLCPNSAAKYAAMEACACSTTCAPVCVTTVVGDGGTVSTCGLKEINPSLACKVCMVNLMGCGVEFNACVNDDGSAPVTTASSTSTGSGCTCPAGTPLCPGGSWQCTEPGDYTHGIAAACGAAQYCAPCCDPTDACSIRGNCKTTKVNSEPCSENYECCSTVCANGKCFNGCGITLPGSGAGASSSSASTGSGG